MESKIKYLIILLAIVLLIPTPIGAVEVLKPAEFNQTYVVIQTCASCTYVNVTISNINGIIVANQAMTNNGSGVWTFNLTPTTLSRHDVTGLGDLDGSDTSFATFFEVTPSGKVPSTGDSLLYVLFSIILFAIIFALSFFVFAMPSKNPKDERGFETEVIKIKYIRIIFIVFIYVLTILLLNFLTGLAVNFSSLTLFAGILGFLFEIMMRLSWAFTVIMIAWIVVMLIHDSNLNKQLKKIMNLRLY